LTSSGCMNVSGDAPRERSRAGNDSRAGARRPASSISRRIDISRDIGRNPRESPEGLITRRLIRGSRWRADTICACAHAQPVASAALLGEKIGGARARANIADTLSAGKLAGRFSAGKECHCYKSSLSTGMNEARDFLTLVRRANRTRRVATTTANRGCALSNDR